MAGRALAALTLAAVLVVSSTHNPCCVRVTSYHVQALAQRMAQRFQALEYRAQDLRGVFAAFQAVHGNATHRLRYLEAEHAHLSEMVSRLDSRVQVLENENRMDEFRQREFYRRGERDTAVRTPIDLLLKPPARLPFMMRRRRQADSTELPHIFVHLDQTNDSSEEIELKTDIKSPSSVSNSTEHSTSVSESVSKESAIREQETVHLDASTVGSEPTSSSPESSQKNTTPLLRALATAQSEQPPQMSHDAPRDSATTPTPLWQLEETASALLDVMSAGDDDVGEGEAAGPDDALGGGVSYWSPANETDSLEKLFGPDDAPTTSTCSEESAGNCTTKLPKSPQAHTEHVSFVVASTEPSTLSANHHDVQFSNKTSNSNESILLLQSGTNSSVRSEDTEVRTVAEANSELSAVNIPNSTVKIPNCKLQNPVEVSAPSDNRSNFTDVLHDIGNNTGPLLDLFSSGAPVSGGGDGEGGAGTGPACGTAGCDAELSDAELQAALKELDALLQRPPASASPPDPEKVLLKRALTLALGALERTSDACLKLVNFTADAFEGLTASEA